VFWYSVYLSSVNFVLNITEPVQIVPERVITRAKQSARSRKFCEFSPSPARDASL
jgi:hypothetical protein